MRFIEKYLSPGDRIGELLCGLIMVLTFTLTSGMLVAKGEKGVGQLLAATIGCNIAWGIIDGFLYVANELMERGRRVRFIEAFRKAPDEPAALARIARELDPQLQPVTTEQERERLYRGILTVMSRAAPRRTRVKKEDLLGALAIFCLEFLCTVPAAVPFMILKDPMAALRVSNGLLLGLLFVLGFRWAHYTGTNPWRSGGAMFLLGGTLVGVAIALGG
ncbi:MAG: VIT1/CCC1 transporter family protein [Acidobacteriota bacterium]